MPFSKICPQCKRGFIARTSCRVTCSRECAVAHTAKLNTIPLEERFLRYSSAKDGRGCMLWTGTLRGRKPQLYGDICVNRKHLYAHRYAWERVHGPVPVGMIVCHRCDEPRCCNVEHLFLGTNADNSADMVAKGRNRPKRGSKNSMAKMTESSVREMRALYASGVPQIELRRMFGLSAGNTFRIVHGLRWTHVA